MLTRNNVCNELKLSPFKLELNNITYIFSSELHLNKFKEQVESNRNKINKSLSNRFNITIKFNILSDIMLYKRIESRGFLIHHDGKYYKCLDNIKLDGENLMNKNLIEL